MPNEKISQMTAVGTVAGTQILPLVKPGDTANYKIEIDEIANYIDSVTSKFIYGYFPGLIVTQTSIVRLYPGYNGSCISISAWTSQAVTSDTVVTVYKNGALFAQVTILNSQTTASASVIGDFLDTDYFTAGVVAQNALNVGFRLETS